VNRRDLRLIAHALGSRDGLPGHSSAADVWRDGRISVRDFLLANSNRGCSTSIRPLAVTGLEVDPSQDQNRDEVIDLATVRIEGRALPNTQVGLVGGSGISGALQTRSDGTGQFRFENVPLPLGTTSFNVSASGRFGQATSEKLTVTRVASVATAMTAQQRMAAFGLTNIKGVCDTPEPSDDVSIPNTPGNYFDSDFWNDGFTPMWSSQQNIPASRATAGRSPDGATWRPSSRSVSTSCTSTTEIPSATTRPSSPPPARMASGSACRFPTTSSASR
jgi:hypothetical protein